MRHCWLMRMLCWPRAVAAELLEPIAGRHPEVVQSLGSVQDEQLAEGCPLGGLIELP